MKATSAGLVDGGKEVDGSGEGLELDGQQEPVLLLQYPDDAGLRLEGGNRLLLVARLTRMGWVVSSWCSGTEMPMPLALRSRQTPSSTCCCWKMVTGALIIMRWKARLSLVLVITQTSSVELIRLAGPQKQLCWPPQER